MVAYEKLAFRQALARSAQLTAPRMGRTLAVTAVLGLLWLPSLASDLLFLRYADPAVALVAAPIVSSFFDTIAVVTWLLALTQFYKALGGKAKATESDDE